MKYLSIIAMALILIATSCGEDKPTIVDRPDYNPTPYDLNFPDFLPIMDMPADNPLTVEGIALGRRLFYDTILSGDNTMSCATCHKAELSFTDERQFSEGIDGSLGSRQAMHIVNLGWTQSLFWDGRTDGLEAQALDPVENPVEMKEDWANAVAELSADTDYPDLFYAAFGEEKITKELAAKAIAQFERTMISGNSLYDQVVQLNEGEFTEEEEAGFEIFNSEVGDCFHCHGTTLFTDNLFHNNGLDDEFADIGLEEVTGNPLDRGVFKTPSLRNIELTAPYMHDGRFQTLEEVIDHYSDGLVNSPTIDPLMLQINHGGLRLDEEQKAQLIAFLKTLTDTSFVNNPAFQSPF